MDILLVDNYDSFVFNLARYFEELGRRVSVVRNDELSVDQVRRLRPSAVVLSPGPGTPRQAGVCVRLVAELAGQVPVLGVCLGHQAVAEAFGARVVRAEQPVHGQTSRIFHTGERLFAGLPCPLVAARYHSLVVDEPSVPDCLAVTARTDEGLVMAVEHRQHPVFGVQFHPESVLTAGGHRLLWNFLRVAGVVAEDARWPPERARLESFPARRLGPAAESASETGSTGPVAGG